ncbi:hypothetical protein [Gordonia sp. NB41Y]|uniref:Rv1157c family protein n=1 Tax=Gordonia sp. NB41Y TaxID=875808 RepID=UPI0026B0FE71|nr:hypothetical protein [Gordonia sp. NB41Y]WLP90014.1 hypothetical protein Q9K23_21175 [Gordonia sp. NB41Y]
MRLQAPMSRSRRLIAATAAVAAFAIPAVALPSTASAAPASTAPAATTSPADQGLTPSTVPAPDQRTLDSLGALAPAIIGSVTTPGPDGRVNSDLLRQASTLAENPTLPTEVQQIWKSVIDFLGEPGKQQLAAHQVAERKVVKPGEPEIPSGPNAPKIQEFLYPTLGFGCMPGNGSQTGGNSLGRALVTAGPQQAPAPGPKRGQAGYVYTSLGTGPAVNNSARALWVSWLNIDNGRTGQLQLKRNAKVNATSGPGTFTGIATTGKGRVISTIYGDVTTKNKGKVTSCPIAPTIGIAII